MKKLVLGLITLLIITCCEKPKVEFSLSGNTTGIKNGTVIYLEDNLKIGPIDSAIVENNTFKFQTTLSNIPILTVLSLKDNSQYRFLWLENNPMTFDATKTDFRNAIITGSKSENLSQTLHKQEGNLPKNERQKLEIKFVEDNPKSIVSAYLLSVYSTAWEKEKTKELYEQFSEENKNTAYGKKISKYIELNKNPKIGEQFVDFEMSDQNGKTKKLSDYKDKIILLEFWASWCKPCRLENPNLVKTYKKFKQYGFEIFAVSSDDEKDSWLGAIKKDKLNWVHVSDLKGYDNMAALIYGIYSWPNNFLIDKNGIIIACNLRGEKLNEKLAEIFPATNSKLPDKSGFGASLTGN